MKVTLTGENSFMLHAELDKLVQQFLSEHGDMALERLDGEEATFERIQEALQSLPFLADKKMVVLRAPSLNRQFAEHAERLLNELPDSTDVILVEPKLDKRLSYYKFLKKATDFQEFVELDRPALARWLVPSAKVQGGTLSQNDALYLVERAGANQQLLSHELEKLLLFDPTVTRQSIELLIDPTPQSTIFELIESAFVGNKKRTLQIYEEQRSLKEEPQKIIAMLAWQLHILALIKTAGDRSFDQIARDARLSPYVVRKSAVIARQLSLGKLKKLVSDLLVIDRRLKREALDADEAMRLYLMKFDQ
jgi:DNA polymerase III subunit delta